MQEFLQEKTPNLDNAPCLLNEDRIRSCTTVKWKPASKQKQPFAKSMGNETKKRTHEEQKKESVIVPQDQDTLFACFLIVRDGVDAYESEVFLRKKGPSASRNLSVQTMKMELVESCLRKHKDRLKKYKFDTFGNMETNLGNDAFLNLSTFFGMCAIENKNVLFVSSKRTIFELSVSAEPEDPLFILHEIPGKDRYHRMQYGIEFKTSCQDEDVKKIRQEYYPLELLSKPIKAISGYKMQDLIDICLKLKLHPSKYEMKKKQEIYDMLLEYFLGSDVVA